jgi:antitoxin (DNA-binding transcriptional repressor) of toxin-antitoxin stability system
MRLHGPGSEVGVRELRDRLSGYLEKVEQGAEIVVTRRGRPVARLSRFERGQPLEELARRGLVRLPEGARRPAGPGVKTEEPISDLVKEQRR